MTKKITIVIFIFFLIEIAFGQFFPNWTFINGTLSTLNKLAIYFSFLTLILCFTILMNARRAVTISLGVFFLIFFCLLSWTEFHAIDTTTDPIDIAIIHKESDGKKLVIREYKNMKTNRTIYDTVLVKDRFILRQFFEK
jgi:hypothetical protein